jgi:histidinol-phosphate aminotransferase
VSHAALVQDWPNVVVIQSFSKTLAMAGLRLGAVIASVAIVDALSRTLSVNAVNGLALDFLGFALAQEQEVLTIHADIRRNRDWLEQRLRRRWPGWRIPHSHANFVFLDTGDTATGTAIIESFARDNVVVRVLDDSEPYRTALRITVCGTDRDRRTLHTLLRIPSSAVRWAAERTS